MALNGGCNLKAQKKVPNLALQGRFLPENIYKGTSKLVTKRKEQIQKGLIVGIQSSSLERGIS